MNLITGATGLLGSHIAEQLHKRDMPIRCLVRKGSDTSYLEQLGAELVYGDLGDEESIRQACQGVACVYHAAAKVGDWGPWDDFVEYTIRGTQRMVDAALDAGVERFVHISSISVYGHVNGKGLVVDETAPLGRELYEWAYYSRAKVEAENIVWDAYKNRNLRLTVIRPSWLYGERDRASIARLVNAIRKGKSKLIGSGDNRLSLSYAGNVAEGCILAAQSDKAIGEAYNCNADGFLTQRQYMNLIAETIGAKPVTRQVPYKVVMSVGLMLECLGRLTRSKKPPYISRYAAWLIGRDVFFDNSKIRRDLGWTPTVDYETGVPRTVRWYLREVEGQDVSD